MEWRPFSQSFVSNTFKEFVSRYDFKSPFSRLNVVNGLPVFRYKPSAKEVQLEADKFTQLRKKVIHQRKLMKSREMETVEKLLQLTDSNPDKHIDVKDEKGKRLNFGKSFGDRKKPPHRHLRTYSTNLYGETGSNSGDETCFFSLTSVARETKAIDLPRLTKDNEQNGRIVLINDVEIESQRRQFARFAEKPSKKTSSNQ